MEIDGNLAGEPGLGRNLTYGLLESLGRAIVTGVYEAQPSRPRPSSPASTRSAARSRARR